MPAAAALTVLLAGTGTVGNAVADGSTRSLPVYHTHTKESATITYKRNGVFDRDGLEKLSWMLRDWRQDQPTSMDPRLFDIVWEVHREVGAQEPLHVVSAYRAPETNAMLRRRSRAVAKHSQHMMGKAVDFYLPDVSMGRVREIALRMQRGGIGYYPSAYNPFVHIDAGSVRHWPRLSREQLTRMFPDGKTVHLPADGKPMPRYEEAAAEVIAAGGTVYAYGSGEEGTGPVVSSRRGKSFFAALFGLDEQEDEEIIRGPRGRKVAARAPAATYAYAPSTSGDDRYVGVSAAAVVEPSPPTARRGARPETVVRPTPAVEPPPAVAVAALTSPASATAVRSVDVPVPPTARPVTVDQPQPGWQQGPAGVPVETAPRVAAVPMPPLRPSDLLPPSMAPVFANVPLPPVRPVAVAALDPVASVLQAPAAGAVTGPAPGAVAGPAPVPADVPLPPVRPWAVQAATDPVVSGSTAPAGGTTTLDRNSLQALFAQTSLGSMPAGRPTVRTTRARSTGTAPEGAAEKPVMAVAMGFGRAPLDLRSDRFTGPAVKPVPSQRFQPANE